MERPNTMANISMGTKETIGTGCGSPRSEAPHPPLDDGDQDSVGGADREQVP
jgi:hypothetical protein